MVNVQLADKIYTEPALQHPLKQLYPKKHYHYAFGDFFSFERERGTVVDWNDARTIFVAEDFVIGLIQGLEEELGNAASVVMYNIGYEWGIRDAAYFKKWFGKEYEIQTDLSQVHFPFLMEAWWWPFTSQGWGNWEVDINERKNGFLFINIFDSVVARTLGEVGKPVCHLYAGLFAGFFSQTVHKSLGCIEIQCYAMGETYCKFLLGKQERVDAATFWQNEGASARDIEKRLTQGEYLQ